MSEIEKTFIELIWQNERLIYKVCSMYISDEFPIGDLYLEEKLYQEIVDITGLMLSNVAVRLKHVKEKLKKMSKN